MGVVEALQEASVTLRGSHPRWPPPSERDYSEVERLLGRKPVGRFFVVARRNSRQGIPAVIACWPIIAPDKPMPTLFWLVDAELNYRVAQVESRGAIVAARAGVDPEKLENAHRRYRELRDGLIPSDYVGPQPRGGIGGTGSGVKCIHAHVAFEVVGGNDPVVAWVNDNFGAEIDLGNLFFDELPPGLGSLERSRG